MPGPGAYGNKVPPNLKKVRRVANRYANSWMGVARASGRPPTSSRKQIRRQVIASVLDRGGKDSLSWRQELRSVKRGIRANRQFAKKLKNRPPFGDAPTRPL